MIRFRKKCRTLLALATVFIIIVTVKKFVFPNYGNSNTRTILFLNTMWGNRSFYFRSGDIFQNCPYKCNATHDNSVMPVEDFDAVFIHMFNDDFNATRLPSHRKPHQRYVFTTLESPGTSLLPEGFDDVFNWTMTYRLDSDIIRPYANIRDKISNSIVAPQERPDWKHAWAYLNKNIKLTEEVEHIIASKTKPAVWFRSHCETFGKRENYVEEIEKYMNVSKLGECSNNPGCEYGDHCYKAIESEYFFYFSFENTLCDDYVTEKLYDVLKYNMVPVVYGGADYSRFAPPFSYINALDFDSPKKLAEYLLMLTKNLDIYKQYFKWKDFYKVDLSFDHTSCSLCQRLHEDTTTTTLNIYDWYNNGCPLQAKLLDQWRSGGPKYATKETL